MSNDINTNDFVKVDTLYGSKIAKILEIFENAGNPVVSVQFVDDGSVAQHGLMGLEKINILSFIKTNCPKCGISWDGRSDGVHNILFCQEHGEEQDLKKEFWKKQLGKE